MENEINWPGKISHCLMCLKCVSHQYDLALDRRNTQNKMFFVLLERCLNQNQSLHGLASVTRFDGKEAEIYNDFPVCEDCFKIVESFCELYHEVKTLELKLDWRIWKLKQIMVCAGKVPSRMTCLQEYSKDKENKIGETFCLVRKEIIRKCANKLCNEFPRISIPRTPLPENTGRLKLNDNMSGDAALSLNCQNIDSAQLSPVLHSQQPKISKFSQKRTRKTKRASKASSLQLNSESQGKLESTRTTHRDTIDAISLSSFGKGNHDQVETPLPATILQTVGLSPEKSQVQNVCLGNEQNNVSSQSNFPTIKDETDSDSDTQDMDTEQSVCDENDDVSNHKIPGFVSESRSSTFDNVEHSRNILPSGPEETFTQTAIMDSVEKTPVKELRPPLLLEVPLLPLDADNLQDDEDKLNAVANQSSDVNLNSKSDNSFENEGEPTRNSHPTSPVVNCCSEVVTTHKTIAKENSSRYRLRKVFSCDNCHKTFSNATSYESHTEDHAGEMNLQLDELIESGDEVDNHNMQEELEEDDRKSLIDCKEVNVSAEEPSSESGSDLDLDTDEDDDKRIKPIKKRIRARACPSTSILNSKGPSEEQLLESRSRMVQLRCPLCQKKFRKRELRLLTNHYVNTHCNKSDVKCETDQPILYDRDCCRDGARIDLQIIEKHLANPTSELAEIASEILMNMKYSCKITACDEVFANPEELETHSKLHGEFKCHFCDVVKHFAPNLALHELDHSRLPKPKKQSTSKIDATTWSPIPRNCPRCSFRSMPNRKYVEHHLWEHLNLKLNRFTCSVCKCAFPPSSIRNVKEHYRAHHDLTGVDPSTVKRCDQCPAFFLKLEQVGAHSRRIHHQGTKKCKDCGKSFQRRPTLVSHRIRTHNAVLNFKCDEDGCEKIFETELELIHHIDYQHRRKWNPTLTCEKCGKQCIGKSGLKSHLASHEMIKKPIKKSKKFIVNSAEKLSM